MALEKELETFRRELPSMLKEHEGQWVLIQADRVDSFWPSEREAVEAGDERFSPWLTFLVKEVLPKERVYRVTVPVVTRCPS
jgi:hypothetical protein